MNRFAEYEQKKEALSTFVSQNPGPFSLGKKTSNLFRNRHSSSQKIDVTHFNQVLSIDPVHLTAEVEGMIPYDALVKETLKHNCLPPVVPELKTITLGGALVGLGIESSSFRYGLVHETILEVEVLTSDGRILLCTPHNEHSDLFYALPNSYGTLGYALKIKLKLIPAKKYLRLENHRFNDIHTYCTQLEHLCHQNRLLHNDTYIDGVIFSPTEMYIITATPTDHVPHLDNFTYMNIYYQSIRRNKTTYLTTYDYIWRWDTDWFWCSKHFGMQNKLLRFLFGKFILTSTSYWKIKRFFSRPFLNSLRNLFSARSEAVIQDILIPIHNAPAFYDFFRHAINITPIWICPFRSTHNHPCPLFPIDSTLYLDFGFWDLVPSTKPPGTLNRLIEHQTQHLHGFKSLYSESFYTPAEFWAIHPQPTYNALKAKYDPKHAFADLYAKCVRQIKK